MLLVEICTKELARSDKSDQDWRKLSKSRISILLSLVPSSARAARCFCSTECAVQGTHTIEVSHLDLEKAAEVPNAAIL